jgi:hypothetical protein
LDGTSYKQTTGRPSSLTLRMIIRPVNLVAVGRDRLIAALIPFDRLWLNLRFNLTFEHPFFRFGTTANLKMMLK